jgi:hypothetical protein
MTNIHTTASDHAGLGVEETCGDPSLRRSFRLFDDPGCWSSKPDGRAGYAKSQ